MDLGLPLDLFLREVLAVATYAALMIVCARHWRRGLWAKVGAVSAALAFVFRAWTLTAFVAATNGERFLVNALDNVARPMMWADLMVLIGLALAVVLGRGRRDPDRP